MKKILFVLTVLSVFYQQNLPLHAKQFFETAHSAKSSDSIISDAFLNKRSKLEVLGEGVVAKLLPDDNSGSRHQRFLIRLSSGYKLLIAHNIDLSPKITSIKKGDLIEFHGQYEWNKKGGVVHWTHKDPRGTHISGWLKHNGKIYE